MLQTIFFLLIVIGLIGNGLNILIYSKAQMRKSLIFQLLLCLSLADFSILLLCGIVSSIEINFNIVLASHSIVACKLETFLTYFLTQTRNFLTMAITIESNEQNFMIL